MITYTLMKSKAKGKKYSMVIKDDKKRKTINFGDIKMEDYTIHKDEERKKRYIQRHSKENWNDLYKAGAWSRYILWEEPSLEQAIKSMEKRFNIKINR